MATEVAEWLTKEQLRERLKLHSTRGVDEMMKRRKIPFCRCGHKTIRFRWPDVEAALEKHTVQAIGRKINEKVADKIHETPPSV